MELSLIYDHESVTEFNDFLKTIIDNVCLISLKNVTKINITISNRNDFLVSNLLKFIQLDIQNLTLDEKITLSNLFRRTSVVFKEYTRVKSLLSDKWTSKYILAYMRKENNSNILLESYFTGNDYSLIIKNDEINKSLEDLVTSQNANLYIYFSKKNKEVHINHNILYINENTDLFDIEHLINVFSENQYVNNFL